MDEKLSSWIAKELKERGWSHRELARRAGMSQTAVSQAISEERKVGWDFCAAIAKPLDKTPVEVLRLAGLLPPEPQPAANEDKLVDAFRRFTPAEQQLLLQILQPGVMVEREESDYQPEPILPDGPPPDLEHIIEIISQLDTFELRLVYDYSCWRLAEQNQRRNSSGKRRMSEEERQKEVDRVLEHLELLIALDEADPVMPNWVIGRLLSILEKRPKGTAAPMVEVPLW